MATNNIMRLSATQFENMNQSGLHGVTLVYRSVNKYGEIHESAVFLSGEDFTPTSGAQEEIFRVWKNVVRCHWDVKLVEMGLKEDNGGIATKLRSGCPAAVVFVKKDGTTAKRIDLSQSVWSRIGLLPTKKDAEKTNRDYKKTMHRAAVASFKALTYEWVFVAEEAEEKPADKKPANKKPADKKAA